ncbi:MAG: glycosyltransferase [Planctomycetota bacterium]|nr:glycosyltransferase [Planctomycetota bacterium]
MADVAVIFPVHNESWLIGSVLGQVTDFARSHPEWTFVFVDDGSSDDTVDLIRAHLDRETITGRIELMPLLPNRGKAGAIREAMLSREEDVLLFTDGDLAYPLEHLPHLVDALESSDVAIGSRALAEGPQTNITTVRRLVGSTFNLLVRLITGLPYRDTQAGLKGFRRNAARSLFQQQRIRDFAFDAELLFLAKRQHLTVTEIPAHVSARHSYKKSRVNMLRDPARMLASLVWMRMIHRGSSRTPQPTVDEKKTTPVMTDGLVEPKPSPQEARERQRTLQR